METYSTSLLPIGGAGRAAAWSAIYATQMSRVNFQPADDRHFDAELRIAQLGPLKLARLSVENCSVKRTAIDITPSAPRMYNFLLQAKGRSTFYHCGHEVELDEGDFVLCDTSLPHHWRTDDMSTTIMVRVEPDVLWDYLPSPEQFCGRRLGRASGLADTVGAMVRSLAERAETNYSGFESRLAHNLLEMIAISYTLGFEGRTHTERLRRRRDDIVRFVEDHLRDPRLGPTTIGAELGLSARHVSKTFAVSGERISAYIQRRRLQECARQLRDPAWNGHRLTDIAFSWAFNSAAHFSRSFHDQFGVSPREYRARAQAWRQGPGSASPIPD